MAILQEKDGLRSESTFKKWLRPPYAAFPEIESTDVVFAGRKLKPAEIEMLALRRGQVVQCSVGDEVEPFSIGSLSDSPIFALRAIRSA